MNRKQRKRLGILVDAEYYGMIGGMLLAVVAVIVSMIHSCN